MVLDGEIEHFAGVRALNDQSRSFELRERSFQAELVPKLSFKLNYLTQSAGLNQGYAPAQSFLALGVLTIPFFDQNNHSTEISRNLRLKNLNSNIVELRKQHYRDLLTDLFQRDDLLARQVQDTTARIHLISRSQEASWTKFRMGKMNYFNFNDIEDSLDDAVKDLNHLQNEKNRCGCQNLRFSSLRTGPKRGEHRTAVFKIGQFEKSEDHSYLVRVFNDLKVPVV